jgi:beta-glucosidase
VTFADGRDPAAAAAVAKAADVAIVVVGDKMSEGYDKPCLGLNCGQNDGIDRDALIQTVAAAQPRTAVVLQSGGPVPTPWRAKVPALLEAWFPGQNGGTAIVRVLFGDDEPGGRLPTTFPERDADLPTANDPEAYPGVAETVRYKEGVLIGYRWFDEKKLDVAYPFGFGLTYTTFEFSDLRLEPSEDPKLVEVSAVVRNTGRRAGTAVPQLYVGMPEPRASVVQPPFQLKGFTKVKLAPGARRRVRFTLDERAFSYWAGGWEIAKGCYRIGVGASSRDLPLQGTVGRGETTCEGALQLPRTSASCASRRAFTIRLPKAMRRATVQLGTRRLRVTRRDGRLTARVDLRGRRPGRVTVKVVGRSRTGKVLRQTRVYRLCTPRSR